MPLPDAVAKVSKDTWRVALKKWAWRSSGFHKYGLKCHDVINETPEVAEAIRRLPKQVQDERNFRQIRAMQISLQQRILPEKDWMTFEQDDYYLTPYLSEVVAEVAEKRAWFKK